MWKLFNRRKKQQSEGPYITVENIVGVTLGWDFRPHLCFKGGYILFGDMDHIAFPQYFKNGDWPTDPTTGDKLPIAHPPSRRK